MKIVPRRGSRRLKKETWMQTHWRPAMAIVYMIIILFDFIIGPVFWSIIQIYGAGSVIIQWAPLTLSSGGIFHAAMGAVLGINSFTRGKEKLEKLKIEEDIFEDEDEDDLPNGGSNE